jgi:hypothetical protein
MSSPPQMRENLFTIDQFESVSLAIVVVVVRRQEYYMAAPLTVPITYTPLLAVV